MSFLSQLSLFLYLEIVSKRYPKDQILLQTPRHILRFNYLVASVGAL
jgi:hypothetical protein